MIHTLSRRAPSRSDRFCVHFDLIWIDSHGQLSTTSGGHGRLGANSILAFVHRRYRTRTCYWTRRFQPVPVVSNCKATGVGRSRVRSFAKLWWIYHGALFSSCNWSSQCQLSDSLSFHGAASFHFSSYPLPCSRKGTIGWRECSSPGSQIALSMEQPICLKCERCYELRSVVRLVRRCCEKGGKRGKVPFLSLNGRTYSTTEFTDGPTNNSLPGQSITLSFLLVVSLPQPSWLPCLQQSRQHYLASQKRYLISWPRTRSSS